MHAEADTPTRTPSHTYRTAHVTQCYGEGRCAHHFFLRPLTYCVLYPAQNPISEKKEAQPDEQPHGLAKPKIILRITKQERHSDDFGLRSPRHSDTIFAKKWYTFIIARVTWPNTHGNIHTYPHGCTHVHVHGVGHMSGGA